ncbi:MAG: DNA-deoxyinosine glycosylase [Methanoregula sp.]
MKRDTMIPCSDVPEGLPPVCGKDPRVLILGSFPGIISLEGARYYGNPQNRFWRIMGDLFDFDASLPYPQRIEQITAHRVALWDVIRCCLREGSADERIRYPVFNNLDGFLDNHPGIILVALNGTAAARYFRQACSATGIDTVLLPSTSPAHARASYEEKREKWKIVKKAAG